MVMKKPSVEIQRVDTGAIQYAKGFIDHLSYISGSEVRPGALETARRRMHLAFSQSSQPELYQCTTESIAYAIALSALSGLMPGGPRPDVWLIARKRQCVWQISARGWVRKARENGANLRAVVVRRSDPLFEIIQGSCPEIRHHPDPDAQHGWETIRGAYVVVTIGDRQSFGYLNIGELAKRRQSAQTDAVWAKWPEEMVIKTMYSYAGAREMFPMDERGRLVAHIDATGELLLPEGNTAALPVPQEMPVVELDDGLSSAEKQEIERIESSEDP